MCKNCGCHKIELEKQEIVVKGMTCDHCKNSVEKAVLGLPGVLAASANVEKGLLAVEYDRRKINDEDIKVKVVEIGFEA